MSIMMPVSVRPRKFHWKTKLLLQKVVQILVGGVYRVAAIQRISAIWLRQGVSPDRLALTLALGFAVGCIPVLGAPTLLCAGLALALRLNLPAIQAANYAAMPFQLVLIAPFLRLGGWLLAFKANPLLGAAASPHLPVTHVITQLAALAGQATLAWFLFALPAVVIITGPLAAMLRRIPVLTAEAGK
jgi:uncharacterized protein (DUF2062 family)